MKYRLGINGFGRIGRNVARINALRKHFDLVAINEINPDLQNLAYLFRYDSTLGRYPGTVRQRDGHLVIDDRAVKVFHEDDAAKVDWKSCGVDVIIECSGVAHNVRAGTALAEAGVIHKMVITHMSPHVDTTIILGVNEDSYDAARHHVVSSAICDANAIGPVLHFLHRRFGLDSGMVTTLHPWLAYQRLVDGPLTSQAFPGHYWHDYRLGRASIGALIPKDTTAVSAFLQVVPELKGRLDAMSYRVPTHVVSSADLNLVFEKEITSASLHAALEDLARSTPVVELNREPLVSVDFEQTDASCLVDMQFARVAGNHMAKVVVWYDNEWGYSNRALDVARLVLGESLGD